MHQFVQHLATCSLNSLRTGVANPGATGCAGFRCYSAVHWSIKQVDCTVNSPHLVLGCELVVIFRVKTNASTPCSPGRGLDSPDFEAFSSRFSRLLVGNYLWFYFNVFVFLLKYELMNDWNLDGEIKPYQWSQKTTALLYLNDFTSLVFRLRPYHSEHARSRLISEAKQGRAWLVLGWETAWEYQVL